MSTQRTSLIFVAASVQYGTGAFQAAHVAAGYTVVIDALPVTLGGTLFAIQDKDVATEYLAVSIDGANTRARVSFDDGGGVTTVTTAIGTIDMDTWNRMVFRIRDDGADLECEVDIRNATGISNTILNGGTWGLMAAKDLGTLGCQNNGGLSAYFDGQIGKFGIWSPRLLPDAEVAWLLDHPAANLTRTYGTDYLNTNLIHYYDHLHEFTAPATLVDHQGAADITLVNFPAIMWTRNFPTRWP